MDKPEIKKMIAPGHYVDNRLEDVWTKEDLDDLTKSAKEGKLKREGGSTPEKTEGSKA